MAIIDPTHGWVNDLEVGTDIQLGPDANLGDVTTSTAFFTDAVDYLIVLGNSIESEDATFTHNIDINLVPQGTGKVNFAYATANTFAYFDASKNLVSTAALTNGQILIGSTGAAPVAATLTAGAGIGIVNAAGSITISATAGGPEIEQIVTDTGGPVLPVLNSVTITGGDNITTNGLGNVLTVSVDGCTTNSLLYV